MNNKDKLEKLPLIELSGTPYEIGFQHGTLLSSSILKVINFYKKVFKKEDSLILKEAEHFRTIINDFNSSFGKEIEGIAKGSNVDPLWIYAINSRSEILTEFISECTAVYFAKNKLLAQNWDWAQELEPLIVLMKITKPNGFQIMQITEPGIIGKIGMNSAGIGVTLNFLHVNSVLKGIPIHITLRHFLEAENKNEAIKELENYKYGKAGNIIVGSSTGDYTNLEFADDKVYINDKGESFIHTNHYLNADDLNNDKEKLASSFSRYIRANEIVTQNANHTIDDIKKMLSDDNNTELPICRPYIPNADIGNVGTVCSVIMDLKNKEIHVTRGNPFENDYVTFNLN